MEDSHHIRNSNRKDTITVKRLLQIIMVIVILLTAFFGYLFWSRGRNPVDINSIFRMEQVPKHLFSIYGNPQKPLKSPMAVYVSRDGRIYAANTNEHEVQVFNASGRYLFSFGRPGQGGGEVAYPYGITENGRGNILVAETGNKRVQEFTPDGEYVGIFAAPNGEVGVEKPGPLFYKNGKLFIGDLIRQEVFVVDEKGKTERVIKDISYPHGVAVDENGKVYISDAGGYRIVITNKKGQERRSIASWEQGGRFSLLRGLALDKVGRIFAVDSINSVIRVFDQDGNYLFSFGSKGFDKGEFLFPTGIFIDGDNKIYVADWANNRIEVWGY